MKKLAILFFMLFGSDAFALTPTDLYYSIEYILKKNPKITEVDICLEGVCENFSGLIWDRRIGGINQEDAVGADGSGAAAAVGDIVGQVGKQVGAGGRIIVDYEKKADGSLKIRVEASFGVGSAAAGAAAASPADKDDK